MKFYVGNLNFRVTEDDLRTLFEPYGPIDDLIILNDRETGRSRGFGFITLGDDEKAKQAYADLNQQDFEGRTLVMNEARPRTDGPQDGPRGKYQKPAPAPGAAGYSRSVGGGYTNSTYGNRAAKPSAPTDSENDDGYVGGNDTTKGGNTGGASGGYGGNTSGGHSGGGGYSRGGNH